MLPGVPPGIIQKGKTGGGGFRPDDIAYFEKVLGQAYNGGQAKSLAGCVATRLFHARDDPNSVGDVNVAYFTMNYILGLPTSNSSAPQGEAAQQVVTDALNACSSGQQATPTTPQAAPQRATLTFSGNGGKSLGNITVPNDSTLVWTDDGDVFDLNDDSYGIYVNSQGRSGTTDVPAGTYNHVTVNAVGNWTIKIVPK
jgi:hypothetical protein